MKNLTDIRSDFPILDQQVNGHPLIYFDNAATSQKPRCVIESLVHFYEHDNANVHRGLHALSNRATAAFENARERLQKFFGCETLVFTRGATEAVNLVARTWGDANINEGDGILLTEMEHHSNLLPWQMLAQRKGAKLHFVPVDENGTLDLAEAAKLLARGDIKIFAFPHISNSLGTINPAQQLCALARDTGVTTLVDAAQSAGHIPFDCRALGCDMLVFSGHKMCGPTGIGGLCGRTEILAAMPPFHGGGEMVREAFFFESTYQDPPHRFEAGTPPIAEAIALAVAADYLNDIGLEAISAHDTALVRPLRKALESIDGFRILGPRGERAALLSFVVEGVHSHDIITMVDQQGLALRGGHHCTQPILRKLGAPSTVRASLYFYNTAEEVARAAEIIARTIRLLRA